MKSITIKIYGKVQGVGLRKFLKRKAIELGINGFTRNEANGTVFLYITSEEEKIETFLDEIKEGPEKADVKFIEVENADRIKFDGFEIR